MSKAPSRFLRIALPFVFIAIGIGGMSTLISNRPQVEQGIAKEIAIPVTTMVATLNTIQVKIPIAGKTTPEQQVLIQPQVSGKVTWVSKKLQKGALFKEKETLFKIDPSDYRLAVKQAKAAVKQAEVSLTVEASRGKVAQKEWNLLGKDSANGSSLALRQPQLELAKSNLEAAKANLKAARLRLKRTKLKAPFNGIVITENVDKGQVVGPGAQLVSFAGVDRSVLEAQIKLSDLEWITLPKANQEGSSVMLEGDQMGKVIGVGGRLDDTARTATLLVGIDAKPTEDKHPLFANSWLKGEVFGQEIEEVMAIPRYAVSDKNTVWIASAENSLTQKSIAPVWMDTNNVYASKSGSDLHPGDNIIISALTTPVEGMRVNNVTAEATSK